MENTKKKSGLTLLLGLVLMAALVVASVNVEGATTSSATEQTATNIVVDFDATDLDSKFSQGQSAILNLVIKNTGGQDATDVEVWVTGNAKVVVDKKLYIGTMKAGETRTTPVWLRAADSGGTGLTAVQIQIKYDGYDSRGNSDNDQTTKWEIPVTVYGQPMFQVSTEKTKYYKDNIDSLVLEITGKTAVKDASIQVSSDCATIVGSSSRYLGSVKENTKTTVSYDLKPTDTGACKADVTISYTDESGSKTSEAITLGLIVEDAGVDFKLVNISYDPTGPGDKVKLNLAVKNVGKSSAEDVALSLALSDPFTTADTSEKYIGKVAGGETIESEFDLAISWEAETKVYSIPLEITYKVGGTTYTSEKDVGIDVGGEVILEIIEVSSSGSSLKIDIANVGTRTAESVKATLIVGEGASYVSGSSSSGAQTQVPGGGNPLGMLTGGRTRQSADTQNTDQEVQEIPMNRSMNGSVTTQQYVSYKSDIKATKQTTFTFSTMISGTATLVLEYTGANNERITRRLPVTVGGTSVASTFSRTTNTKGGGTDTTTYLIYGAVILVAGFFGYRFYKKRKGN